MKIIIQKTRKAVLKNNGNFGCKIENGLIVFLAICKNDNQNDLELVVDRIINAKIIPDEKGRFGSSVKELNQSIMLVPQFTMSADIRTKKLSFIEAEEAQKAKKIFNDVFAKISSYGVEVKKGEFGAYMEIEYTNEGPVNFYLDSRSK